MLALQLGLLLLTTYAGLILLAMIAVFLGITRRGRRALRSAEPWLASTMIVVVLFPRLIWLDLSSGVATISFRPFRATMDPPPTSRTGSAYSGRFSSPMRA